MIVLWFFPLTYNIKIKWKLNMNDHKNSSIRRRGKLDCRECREATWEVYCVGL